MGKISTYSTDKKYNGQILYYYSKEYNIMGKFQYIFITQKYYMYDNYLSTREVKVQTCPVSHMQVL